MLPTEGGVTDWRVAHIGFEDDGAKIGSIEVWKETWRRVDSPRVILPHPAYPNQRHGYGIFEIGDERRPVRFAAGELSPGVWGFYVPRRNHWLDIRRLRKALSRFLT